jgi:protein TonB
VRRQRGGSLWSADRFIGVAVSAGVHALLAAGLWLQPKPSPGPESPVMTVQLLGHAMDARTDHADQPRRDAQAQSRLIPAVVAIHGAPVAPAPDPAPGEVGVISQASASASTSAPSAGLAGQSELHYQDELLAYIGRFRAYPDAARSARLVGQVMVRFAMSRDGKVLDVWIDRSSGQAILDNAAKDTVLRAQPLPPIPTSLPGVLTLSLPVDFSPPGPI